MDKTSRKMNSANEFIAAAFLLLALMVFGPVEARAQWAADANNNIHNTNSGNVGVGTPDPAFNLHITSSTDPAAVAVDGYGNVGVNFIGRRANGTAALPSASLANNNLFTLQARGYGSTGFSTSSRANIKMFASENWSDTSQGTYITFATTANGSTTTSERLRIDNAGNVGIGTAAPGTRLHVNGTTLSGISAGTSGDYNARSLMVTARPLNDGVASLGFDSNSTYRGAFDFNGSSGLLAWYTNGGSGWSPNFVIAASGGVGIGTATPGAAYKLDVAGSVNSTGLCLNGDCRSTWSQVGSQ
jgi:hypothetical protein